MPISYFPNNGLPDYYFDVGYWGTPLARTVREYAYAGIAAIHDIAGIVTLQDRAGTPSVVPT